MDDVSCDGVAKGVRTGLRSRGDRCPGRSRIILRLVASSCKKSKSKELWSSLTLVETIGKIRGSRVANGEYRMEKPESSMGEESNVELEDRDPNSLNTHLQVMWDDVIGEPEGIRSPECAWRLSGHCFRLSRSCCYVLLSVLVAPLLALCFGFTFACLAFQHIWCLAPCLRVWKITFAAARNFFTTVTQAIIRPVMDSLGYLFHNIRVMNQKLPEGPAEKDDILVV